MDYRVLDAVIARPASRATSAAIQEWYSRSDGDIIVIARPGNYSLNKMEETMIDIAQISDNELLTAAGATSVDFSDAATAPSVMAGEPCDS
ncbi:hypothetical protein SAMN05216266_11038 [Amycolatopsis marina]|uniref:Uncharacterized protein n=1 Tax=Amycolatopsis marina TaxID=490629 RepID=A0A1I1AU88_9PSEU|nr:hypothetical protein SAMN05216266_11038 [Amycolatopsis marina]